MKRSFLIFLSILLFSTLNCCASQNLITKNIKVDGLERTYHIQIPSSYNGKEPLPVIFILHGGGGTGKEIMKYTGFDKLAEKYGFIAVYPDAYRKNWHDARNFLATRIDDVKFFKEMIQHISEEFKIDRTRIYATGISNGAMMCFTLGCRLSESFAAIAAVAGNLPENLKHEKPSTPLSVLIMNGTDDPLVPYEGGSIKVFGRERGKVLSTKETVEFWVKANGCNTIPVSGTISDKTKTDSSTVFFDLYKNPANNIEVVLYRIEGGGHTWPGAFQYLPESIIGKTNKDIEAQDIIWQFFKRHKKETK